MNFLDKKITFWTITYNSDVKSVYVVHKFDGVINAIEGSIRGYLIEDTEIVEALISDIIEDLRPLEECQCIPIIYNKLRILVNRYDLDNTSYIHKLLAECYEQVDSGLKAKIDYVYSAADI